MKRKTKILLIPFIFASIITTSAVTSNVNSKRINTKLPLLEIINNKEIIKFQEQITNLSSQRIENNFKNSLVNLENRKQNSSFVSYTSESPILRKFPTSIPTFSFPGFWSLLSEVERGLFITFLAGAGTAVLSGIGYGIYKGIQNSRNSVNIDAQSQNVENIEQSVEGNYKLTFKITKESEKNRSWSVYAFGQGLPENKEKIGTFSKTEVDEKEKMQGSNGEFTYTFDNIKDPNGVNVILKFKNEGPHNQTEPFKLSDFLPSGTRKNDSNIYFNDDEEWDYSTGKLKKKAGIQSLGEITVTKDSKTSNK